MDKESDRERIGARIAELRKAKGLTQAQLAEKTGFSQSNIGRIETGRYSVGLDVLTKIADALGATVELVTEASSTP
jgi:transcriptional regulator with XRE-family HTH domain